MHVATVIPAANPLSSLLWTATLPYGSLGQPLIYAGDRLIGASATSTIFTLNIYDGTLPTLVDSVPALGFPYRLHYGSDSPAVACGDGMLYFLDKGQLVALHLADGLPLDGWPPISLDNVYSLQVLDGRLIALYTDDSGNTCGCAYERHTGKVVFGPVQLSTDSPGTVSYGQNVALFTNGGTLNAVNVDFGDVRWQYTPPATVGALDTSFTPMVAGQLVLAASTDLIALDLVHGTLLWSVPPSVAAGVTWATPVLDSSGKIAVASNSGGDVFGISLDDGSTVWHTSVTAPGAPAILDDVVTLVAAGGQSLVRLAVANGAALGCFTLPAYANEQPPLTGNGAVYLVTDGGNSVSAYSFASENAAYFDGLASRIDIEPEGTQLDFGLNDFTVETWFKSSVGGELISSFATQDGPNSHGFRLNLTSDGRFQVAVLNAAMDNLNVGRTLRTGACDGAWHHVAFMRRNGVFVVLLDGQALQVRLPATLAALNAIGGCTRLTLGAYRPCADPATTPEAHFMGLMREVRIWNRALDVATIQTNLRVELTGQEPCLIGLWRLDENQGGGVCQPVNAVQNHRYTSSFNKSASVPTDLTMDDSAFPYLIQEVAPQWPYAGTWAARGEAEVRGLAALSSDGTLAFGTNNYLYGVNKADGKRRWSCGISTGASAPAADGDAFYAVTGAGSLLRIDSSSGAAQQVPGFANLIQGTPDCLAAPALSTDWIAVGTPDGCVHIGARTGQGGARVPASVQLAAPVRSLAFSGAVLVCLSGPDGAFQISAIDPATAAVIGTPLEVVSDQFWLGSSALICIGRQGLARYDLRFKGGALASAVLPAPISGLAAWPDADLLAVATADGDVHCLSLAKMLPRWTTTIPHAQAAPDCRVHQPAFDDRGRIYCTTTAGTVAVLDPDTGNLLGAMFEQQPITSSALLDAGTAYFGCADPLDPTAATDGALHSVVLGQTIALRLGLDAHGKSVPDTQGHAVIEAADADATLHLMDASACCVEAWVNIPPSSAGAAGGGLLGICPSGQASSFDLNLSVDADGTVRYRSRSMTAAGWSGISAQGPAGICDGKWHHVAVSRQQSGITMYIDGTALAAVTSAASSDAPASTVAGLKAYLGAIAGPDLAPSQPFCGMIAEIRVWDTYLESTEIAARMHVKLRGDEPDLLAYWNFDRQAIHDSARQGHDGQLTGTAAGPAWWLTDLPFVLPSYPYIASTASIQQVGEAGAPGTDGDTLYALELAVRRADQTGLPTQEVKLWYVRHDDSEPATITLNGVTLTGVQAGAGMEPAAGAASVGGSDVPVYCYSTSTLGDGRITIPVATPQLGHGPSLDVWTAFMPVNERFHVNCLIDNQLLATPVPPSLTAQTKLIQDYHYSTGNKIDETRDRSTHRVVITAANPDHSPRADERVTLWASDDMQIEAGGASWSINADNSADFSTNAHGELVVVIAADELKTPTLYARAGFMHRNDRVVISPAEDAQKQLGAISATTLTKPRLANWRPNHDAGDMKTILGPDYQPHAADIASAVRNVMSAVQPRPIAPATNRLMRDASRSAPAQFVDMRQPRRPACADSATVYRATAHVLRKAPINVDALRASLGGNVGFVFTAGSGGAGFDFQMLKTQADVDNLPKPPSRLHPLFASIFSKAWDSIKDTAEDLYEDAQKIVVYVSEVVNVAIHALDGIVNLVVDSVEKAIDAVVNFFKKLIADIKFLILLLRALLDWDGISGASKLIRTMFHRCGQIIGSPDTLKPVTDGINAFFDSAEHTLGLDSSDMTTTCLADLPQEDSDAISLSNGVHAKMMYQKTQEHGFGSESPSSGIWAGASSADAFLAAFINDVGTGVAKLASDLPGMNFRDMNTNLKALVRALGSDVFEGGRSWTLQSINSLASSFDGWLTLSETPIDIPFISPLYKWITGDDLTALDLVCFLLGFPAHVVYFLYTEGDRFSDVGQDWLPAPASAPAARASLVCGDTRAIEVIYLVLKSVHTLLMLGTDATFQQNENTRMRAWFKLGRGLTGCVCAVLVFTYFRPRYLELVNQQHSDAATEFQISMPDGIQVLIENAAIIGFTLSLTADGTAFVTGAYRLFQNGCGPAPAAGVDIVGPGDANAGGGANPPAPQAVNPLNPPAGIDMARYLNNGEALICVTNSLVALAQIVVTGITLDHALKDMQEGNSKTLTTLVAARYLTLCVPRLFGWMYTNRCGKALNNPYIKAAVAGTRGAANVTGMALHGTAAFNHMGL